MRLAISLMLSLTILLSSSILILLITISLFYLATPYLIILKQTFFHILSSKEIKTTIFIFPNKFSLGPEGFNFEFYKHSWDIIGDTLCKAIKHFFSRKSLPKISKAITIILIHKQSHARDISNFRLLSLCNTFYKIIAKALANHFKKVIHLIIHPSQSGFIHGHISTDNVILANDILQDITTFLS